MQEIERWVPIDGAKGYQISDRGNIKGRRGRLIKITLNRKGYPYFAMPYFNCNHSTISKIRRGKHYPNVTI